MPFAVRPLTVADVLQVQAIEREVFPGHFPPTPFGRELQNSTISHLVACRVPITPPGLSGRPPADRRVTAGSGPARLAATIRNASAGLWRASGPAGEPIAGFLGAWYAADEAHVITFGVRRTDRGRGVGELLLIAAIEQAYARGATAVTLEVRPSNFAARNLYGKYGFDVSGVRKGYYADNREDALIMTAGPIRDLSYVDAFARAKGEHRRRWGEATLPAPLRAPRRSIDAAPRERAAGSSAPDGSRAVRCTDR